ncbi:MAG: hypothetical protein ACFCBW_11850 [Candidatus Competibacterales bacterium]
MATLALLLATLSVVFHLGLVFVGLVPHLISRPCHLALALPWLFLFAPSHGLSRWVGYLLGVAGLGAVGYVLFNRPPLEDQ